MAVGEKIIPLRGINVDVHESLMPPDQARFIKNLVYELGDSSNATSTQGGQSGVFKPVESTQLYIDDLVLPVGYNHTIGYCVSEETREVFVFVYNSNDNHTIYKLNGYDRTYNIVYQGECLNFQLKPEFFIHESGSYLEVIYITNPETGESIKRSFLFITDGYNYQRFIAVEDSIATNGFDANLFPYFLGDYDKCQPINMGVATPKDCIAITEVPVTESSVQQNNRLLFNTWQFRLLYIDVWGRPSEHGIISDMYIPSAGNCVTSAGSLARCLNLTFDAPPPHIDKIQVEYRNCNSQQWYISDVLELYDGSILGQWWTRQRNADINYNSGTGKITYQFCADKECDAIAPDETNRLSNPLPKSSQAVAKIGNFIGLGSNKDGFIPFSKELRDSIQVTVTPPAQSESTAYRNIRVLIEIRNAYVTGENQPIYYQGIDSESNKAYGFGAFGSEFQYRSFFAYRQYFRNREQKGFIGYLAGTNYFTISKQYALESNGTFTEVTDFVNLRRDVKYFQVFDFLNIPVGRYIFRLASHQSDPTDSNYQSTSTYVSGTYSFNFNNYSNPTNIAQRVNFNKELVIDVCNGNYDTRNDNRILVVSDLNWFRSTVADGYVYNTDNTQQQRYGVELLRVNGGGSGGDDIANFLQETAYTDHNGFYFTATESSNAEYRITGYCSCNLIVLINNTDFSDDNVLVSRDFFLNRDNENNCKDWETRTCNYTIVRGQVKFCNSDAGVPGISVVLTRGRTAVTDSNGNFQIIAFDDTRNPVRADSLYFIPSTCNFSGCDSNCIQPVSVVIQKCITCIDRTIEIQDVFVRQRPQIRGLLSGGTYPVGVVGWDWLGRPTFVQDLGDINIPSVQTTQIFSPSAVSINILPTATFSNEIRYITFWIGEETTIQDYVTWIVDRLEFIDNSGLVNTINPTQIRIYYRSLIEYNVQNQFNTTVNWSFISEDTNEPVLSDRVEFLLNGDGTFFSKSIVELVKYQRDGQYFLVNYTEDLKDLKQNAIIRLVRPKQCAGTEPLFELCSTVEIVNNKAIINNLTLNAFDTYYITRQIPVPVPQGDETANELRLIGVPFEHNSPSDFWGEGCKNVGRVNVKNPYETELYHREQIALSGALSDTGQLNFLCYFDDSKKTDFNDTKINGIVAILPETQTILVVGQNDCFIVGFSDTIARVNAQGQVVAPSIENQFGQPQTNVGSNYGCKLFDKNTISRRQGLVQFLDTTESALIQHNYQNGQPVSYNSVDGYIRAKIKAVQAYNLQNDNKRYFTGIVNPINNEYLLSDAIIGDNNFVNNLRGIDVTARETISFGIYTKVWKGWYGFTPECYARLSSDIEDKQLFSFVNGQPHSHYSTNQNKTYGTIYGQKVNRVFEVVSVFDNFKKKKPLSIFEYCRSDVYFADRVLTETGQESRVLISQFLQSEYGWYAPFLCDLNTLFDSNLPKQTGDNKLMDGNPLVGTWIKIRLIGSPSDDDRYSELQGIVVNVFPSEKSGT